jgi:hypothetical protein
MCALYVAILPGAFLHRPSTQHVAFQSICEPPLFIIVSRIGLLHACGPPPTIFASRTAIPHTRGPLLVTFVSHVALIHRSKPLPTNVESPSIILPRSKPPQVTSEFHVAIPRALFLLLVLSTHRAKTASLSSLKLWRGLRFLPYLFV